MRESAAISPLPQTERAAPVESARLPGKLRPRRSIMRNGHAPDEVDEDDDQAGQWQ